MEWGEEFWHERQRCMVPRLWPYCGRHFYLKGDPTELKFILNLFLRLWGNLLSETYVIFTRILEHFDNRIPKDTNILLHLLELHKDI